MAECGNLGSNEALARDNEINKITLDPVLPPMGGPGPAENPPWAQPPLKNVIGHAIANVVPGHTSVGERAAYQRRSILPRR